MSRLELLGRGAWNARPRRHHPGSLDAADVRGLAFHWPGTQSSRPLSKAAVPRALRSWQSFHMDGRGWSDIAYQAAVDQWGRVWELRGLANRSAANGGTDVNGTYGAVLLVLVQNEEPTAEMVAAVRRVVAEHRRLFPKSRQLVGHGDIRPGGWTDCPGPAVRRRLRLEDFEPREEEEVTEKDIRAIAKATADELLDRLENDTNRLRRLIRMVRSLGKQAGLEPDRPNKRK